MTRSRNGGGREPNLEALPRVVPREAWLEARKELLAAEKELTRARDALNAARRRLPMVRVDTAYAFAGPDGEATLRDLFEGRPQLIVYHFMFDPAWERGCRSCSAFVDEISRGQLRHLHERGTTLALVSRAPLPKLLAFRERMGWDFLPWYSSHGNDFNVDYHVTLDPERGPLVYNFAPVEGAPADDAPAEHPGLSVFLRHGDAVFHTYSTYARGAEQVGGSHYFLDLTALGRQEAWEEPQGRLTGLGAGAGSDGIRYPDEYDD